MFIDHEAVFLFNLIMQFESLKVFCDLAETESFTKAAQINSVSQSAVSQTISALERHFNSLLIERSKKNFRLTTEGEVLYNYSKEMLQSYDAIHSRMQEIKHVISGDIRVATVYSLGLHDLPPYVRRFMQSYPGVNVHVEYRRANQVYMKVCWETSWIWAWLLTRRPMRSSRLSNYEGTRWCSPATRSTPWPS